jgi:hypothetical protein
MGLTRYLYMSDEVMYSFIDCLLRRKNLRKCYFWIAEYYFSGFRAKTWSLLWKIFYDFYAVTHPKLEGILSKEYAKWNKQPSIAYILHVTLNLFKRVPNCEVFMLRHITPGDDYTPRGRIPGWVKDFDESYKSLVLALEAKKYHDIIFHSQKIDPDALYKLICKYFKTRQNISLNESSLKSIPYKNRYHIIVALILHLQKPEEEIDLESTHYIARHRDIIWIKNLNRNVVKPLYRTLGMKRLYTISPNIGCFNLCRFDKRYPTNKYLLGFKWQYFASFSPLWQKRFARYKATRQKSTFEMLFPSDDELEAFGEKYDYEPDEQGLAIQYKSIRPIEISTPNYWLFDVFGTYNHEITKFAAY